MKFLKGKKAMKMIEEKSKIKEEEKKEDNVNYFEPLPPPKLTTN